MYEKSSKSNKGFGRYTLCESCNNKTGDWYARDYANFAAQAMEQLKIHDGPYGEFILDFRIKPLNVIKQVMAMFISSNHGGILGSDPEMMNFILDRQKTRIPEKYGVYIYYTLSKNKRMNGIQTIRRENGEIVNWSEINFNPFGFILTIDSPPPNEFMADISAFANQIYDKEFRLKITAAYLKVSSPWNGQYENA